MNKLYLTNIKQSAINEQKSLLKVLEKYSKIYKYTITSSRYYKNDAHGYVTLWSLQPEKPIAIPIIFFHGAGCNALFPQLELFISLLATGHPVFTINMDGHGGLDDSIFTSAGLRTTVSSALDFIEQQKMSKQPFHLVGYSMGASAILHALGNKEDRAAVASLVAMPTLVTNSAITQIITELCLVPINKSIYRQLQFYDWHSLLPSLVIFKRDAYPIRHTHIEISMNSNPLIQLINKISCVAQFNNTTSVIIEAVNEAIGLSNLKRISLPVQFLHGSHDFISPASGGYSHAKQLSCKAVVRILSKETHYTSIFAKNLAMKIQAWGKQHQDS